MFDGRKLQLVKMNFVSRRVTYKSSVKSPFIVNVTYDSESVPALNRPPDQEATAPANEFIGDQIG